MDIQAIHGVIAEKKGLQYNLQPRSCLWKTLYILLLFFYEFKIDHRPVAKDDRSDRYQTGKGHS